MTNNLNELIATCESNLISSKKKLDDITEFMKKKYSIKDIELIASAELNQIDNLLSGYYMNDEEKDIVPFIKNNQLAPIAHDNGGNYVMYSLKTKKYYFLDHEDLTKVRKAYNSFKDIYKNNYKSDTVVESYIFNDEDEVVLESYLSKALESKITTEERKALPDSAFGLPQQRKYPLHLKTDEESITHIKQAIKFFHFCPGKDRKELAKNIKAAATRYGIEIEEKSMINKYL